MPKLQEMMTVVSQREVARDIFEMVLTGEIVADMEVPGQFLHIKVPNDAMLLRRPISISSWDSETNTCTILYRAGDEVTGTRLLSVLTAGQKIDVMGPLGHGFPIDEVKKGERVLIVGGGIGVPPLYELAKRLSKVSCKITVLLGFASKEVKILEQEFRELSNVELKVATDDGSYGTQGHVGLLMNDLDFEPDAVYTCGAAPMLKAVAQKYDTLERLYISMESRMACGIGACYACVEHDKNDESKALKVCEDGPVFTGNEVLL
ncbi:dihydroorotate dehydrogenase electron transfer subunit [Lactococcus allomyrinae]|uniref:Dihydroorotate dehydrogenase B (NAD(+)), electron transfer subunit n=1 Tax=Lactococcus allomyrinae TaxID=2419773 RepID=A0A387BG96_9LACT|nr:dihydroorotate dehydrogenase electron transfer subunit [Lactococcus allomyrinae]AYG00156.1 dihydroorotate dehydrogenase electron transfer subunit [Lactococcus allomyrinae]